MGALKNAAFPSPGNLVTDKDDTQDSKRPQILSVWKCAEQGEIHKGDFAILLWYSRTVVSSPLIL